jgi:signal peptidase II
MNPHVSRLLLLLVVIFGTVGCDQTTKYVARKALVGQSAVRLPGGVGQLVLAQNEGGHLSFGATWSKPIRRICFVFVVGTFLLALGCFLIWKTALGRFQFTCLACVVAGGASNLIDRTWQHGAVTDFIYLQMGSLHTGVFNLADVVLEVSVVGFIMSTVRRTKDAKAEAR